MKVTDPDTGTLQERLRHRLKIELEACPTCGHPTKSIRDLAKKTGLPVTTLWRFLGGKGADGETLDRIDRFLSS